MWRIMLFSLALTLSGCGYKTWWNPPFSSGYTPNVPVNDSENMQRVLGGGSSAEPIMTEPGDIWPKSLPPAPTLQDLEASGGVNPQPEQPVPGSPLSRGVNPAPMVSPNPSGGSSTPPANLQPPALMPTPRPAPPLSSYAAPAPAPLSNGQAGQVLQTPSGPSVVTGGGPGYSTTTSPGGGQSIVVPNGNGTSTVIHPDGRIETIPTPK